jgi:hypothetical protein
MRWLGVSPWRQHPIWSIMGSERARRGTEMLRPLEWYYAENIPALEVTPSLAPDAPYRGPRIVRSLSPPARNWVWIESGSASALERYAVPRTLSSESKFELAPPRRSQTVGPTATEQFDEITEGHDPLFDEPPGAARPESGLREVPLPRGVKSLEDLRIVIVKVLGPVELEGWLCPPERAMVTELACYLALHHDRRFSGEQLRFALRPDGEHEPSAKTMRTYLSQLRKCLGPDYLSSGGGYEFPWWVDSDFAIFKRTSETERLANRVHSLEFIRGRPFEGVPAATYGWVFSELWISEIETTIVSIAHRIALECLEAGLIEKAEHCVRQGLLGVPQDLSLWELRLRIAAQSSDGALERAKDEAAATLGSDALSSFGR